MHRPLSYLVILALVAASCGRGLDESAPGTTTSTTTTTTTTTVPVDDLPPPEAAILQIWVLPEHATAIEPAIAAFTTALGAEVELTIAGQDDIAAAVAAGEIPDVFPVPHLLAGDLVERGVLAPLRIGSRADEFDAGAIAAFTVGGDVYGIPHAVEVPLLYYATDLVPEPPAGFSQVKELCSPPPPPPEEPPDDGTTTSTTSTTTTTTTQPQPDAACVLVPLDGAAALLGFLATTGGYLFGPGRDTSDVGIDGDGAASAAATMREFVAVDVFSTAPTAAEAVQALVTGTARFAIVPPSAVGVNLPAGIAVAQLPFFAGERPRPPSRVAGYVLGANDANRGDATIFLLDYLSAEQTMLDIAATTAAVPAHLGVRAALDREPATTAVSGATPIPPVPGITLVLTELGELTRRLIGGSDPVATVLETTADSIRNIVGTAGD